MSKSGKGAPKGYTHQKVDHIAARLLQTSKDPDVRSVAGAALSDTRTSPRAHNPIAHTSAKVASTAGELLATSRSAAVRSVAASVLSDRQTKKS
jgi:hypothetical protein